MQQFPPFAGQPPGWTRLYTHTRSGGARDCVTSEATRYGLDRTTRRRKRSRGRQAVQPRTCLAPLAAQLHTAHAASLDCTRSLGLTTCSSPPPPARLASPRSVNPDPLAFSATPGVPGNATLCPTDLSKSTRCAFSSLLPRRCLPTGPTDWDSWTADRTTPFPLYRWGSSVALFLLFTLRIFWVQAYYIVAYALGCVPSSQLPTRKKSRPG